MYYGSMMFAVEQIKQRKGRKIKILGRIAALFGGTDSTMFLFAFSFDKLLLLVLIFSSVGF